MNKSDYNSHFKMKISRSLTDLQNSLDEACRLGLPPNFHTNDDEIPRNYNCVNDISYKANAQTLANMISKHESSLPPAHMGQFISRNDDRGSNNSANVGNNREIYLNVLRSLADNGRSEKARRSRSQDLLNVSDRRGSMDEIRVIREKEMMLMNEVRILRQRIVDMDEEMIRMKSINSTMEFKTVECDCADLRRKIETYKVRESELLAQLNEAVLTIEEAKYEEMQAVMELEKSKEELENMQNRFKEYVNENVKKMTYSSVDVEKEMQMVIYRTKEEFESVKSDLGEKLGECQRLRERLKNANSEIDRFHMILKNVENDKARIEHNLECSVARAVTERDECLIRNKKLQSLLDKERSERQSEKLIWEEELNNIRHRVSTAEYNQVNINQEKIDLLNERDAVKFEMLKMKQLISNENIREQEERKKREKDMNDRIEKLQKDSSRKQIYLQDVINEAEEVMTKQNVIIKKMKRELSLNVEEIEGLREKFREERDELHWRLSKSNDDSNILLTRLKEMEDLLEEENCTFMDLRTKYKSLEIIKGDQDKEIISLLTSNNGMMKNVELLQMKLREFRRRVGDCNCGVFDSGEQLINEKILEYVVNVM